MHLSGCSATADPRSSETEDWTHLKWPHWDKAPPDPIDKGGWARDPSYQDLAAKADAAWRDYTKALDHESEVENEFGKDSKESEEAKQVAEEARKKANEAIEKRNAWKPKVASAGDYNPPPSDGPATARPSTDGPATCAELQKELEEMLRECERTNWASNACQDLKGRLEGCYKRGVTDPVAAEDSSSPKGGAAPKQRPCGGAIAIDASDIADAVLHNCNAYVHPAPDGGDPCAPLKADGERNDRGGDSTACGNSHGLTTDEQCGATLSDPSQLLPDSQATGQNACLAAGLPYCTFTGGGNPPPGGPQPSGPELGGGLVVQKP
jgi:hypothetical protein